MMINDKDKKNDFHDFQSIWKNIRTVADNLGIISRGLSEESIEQFLKNCLMHNQYFKKTEIRPGIIRIGAIFAKHLKEVSKGFSPVDQSAFVGVTILSVIDAEEESHSKHDSIGFIGGFPEVLEKSLPDQDDLGPLDRELFADDVAQILIELDIL